MALLLKNGCVFVHIPKTGGTWVTDVLREQGLVRCRVGHKHADLERLRDCWRHAPTQMLKRTLRHGPNVAQRVRTATKFCFVRHPLRWYESYFRFMKGLGWRHFGGISTSRWHPNAELFDLGSDTLDGFMRNVLDRSPGYLTRMYEAFTGPVTGDPAHTGPITQHVGDPAIACAFIGRQERLADDLIDILRRAGVAIDEDRIKASPPRNVSRSSGDGSQRPAREQWDPGLLRAVLDAEAGAFDRYGYERSPRRPVSLAV